LAATVLAGLSAGADHPAGLAAGMLVVATMAAQNAIGPLALPNAPPTAVMTSFTTGLCVDPSLLLARPSADGHQQEIAHHEACLLALQGAGYLAGGGAAAVSHGLLATWALATWALALPAACLALPLLLSRSAVVLAQQRRQNDAVPDQ
jgi:hypothetical protein